MGCSYSLGTLIQAMEINNGRKRRGFGGKAPKKFFEDTPLAYNTFRDARSKREFLSFCIKFFFINWHLPDKFQVNTTLFGSDKGAVIFNAGYWGGRIFGGVPNFWPRFIGVSNISEKIVKCLMGCKMFGIHFRLK